LLSACRAKHSPRALEHDFSRSAGRLRPRRLGRATPGTTGDDWFRGGFAL